MGVSPLAAKAKAFMAGEEAGPERSNTVRGAGRAVFAGIMLLIVGTINIIYGIGALDDARIFVNDTRYIFTTSTPWAGS